MHIGIAEAPDRCAYRLCRVTGQMCIGIAESLDRYAWALPSHSPVTIFILNDVQHCAVSVAGFRAQLLGSIGCLLPTHMEMH